MLRLRKYNLNRGVTKHGLWIERRREKKKKKTDLLIHIDLNFASSSVIRRSIFLKRIDLNRFALKKRKKISNGIRIRVSIRRRFVSILRRRTKKKKYPPDTFVKYSLANPTLGITPPNWTGYRKIENKAAALGTAETWTNLETATNAFLKRSERVKLEQL